MEGTQLNKATAWVIENPTESIAVACRLFGVPRSTLRSSVTRAAQPQVSHGGHNKILSDTQVTALKQWIRLQYEKGLGATRHMTYAAVCHLRKPLQPPSQSWLNKFIKSELHDFHFIKTKPISHQRSTAQDKTLVTKWFSTYSQFLSENQILPDNIWNMDETGFQVGIPGGEEVIVPITAFELYTPSPENKTSITIIEAVSASGKVTPPVLIIPGKVHMESWYHESLSGTERILLSESGYTNDQLAIEWLQHFIHHTGSSRDSDPKVLLLDSHTSHCTPEFSLLAAENNIHIYAFPSHLTHVLQPLDVGVFQPYKHWHKEAVHIAIRNLNLEYNICSFMRDLPGIRAKTFKPQTITHAFANSGVWPVNSSCAITKLQKYSKPEPQLPQTPAPIPASLRDSETQLQHWKPKILVLLSSPSRQRYESWAAGTEQVLVSAQLQELDFSILERQVMEQRNQRSKSRRTLQIGGALTVENARRLQAQKLQKEANKKAKQEARTAKSATIQARKELRQAGIQARKQERLRKKRVAALRKAGQLGPPEDQEPIPDPEVQAQA